jgi:hypothetical protein
MIPIIYDLAEAARILGFSESYLRSKLRDRTFAGMKRAGIRPHPRDCRSTADTHDAYATAAHETRRLSRFG